MSVKENDYTCGTCKHYDRDNDYCMASGNHEIYEEDTCEYWEEDKDELTDDERYDGGVMSNFDNENPKEVEDYINEGREIE